MFNLDSLTLKYFFSENYDFINGAIVQKIQLPSRYEVILTIRNLNKNKAQNKKLYININPKYPHICFIDEKTSALRDIKIPIKPPMFCMQLRKYLNGSKIKDFNFKEYDRILEFYFDYFNEIGSLTKICMAVEFMGKYSNIIIYNAISKEIIGVAHNVSNEKSSIRELYGGAKYIYPPLKEKLDILKISYSTFYEIAKSYDIKEISNNFYYLNQALVEKIFQEFDDLEVIFKFLQELISLNNSKYICDFWGDLSNINNSIDDYFAKIMFKDIMNNKKASLKKSLSNEYKKIKSNIKFAPDSSKMTKIKNDADELMTKGEIKEAQKLYNQYKKAKTEFSYTQERYKKAKEKFDYFESIIFNIENSKTFLELEEIKDELIGLNLIKDKKTNTKPAIQKIDFEGWEIYIGKNNKQNDYLISKIANNEDLWFHGLNYPSAHVILKIPNNGSTPSREVLEFCAKITKENSKARDGGKASIIMTKRKNLKKPPDTYLGYVTYKNEIEIVI